MDRTRCRVLLLSLMVVMLATSAVEPAWSPSRAAPVGHVVINEFLPDPDSDWNGDGESSDASDEFIELYNPTGGEVEVSGWVLDDIEDGGSTPFTIADGTFIPEGGRLTFFSADTDIALNNNGDEVRLLDNVGVLVDSRSYSSCQKDVSFTRSPDGDEAWTTTPTPTPSVPPPVPMATHVVINEVLPDPDSDWNGDGESSDASDEFIELYNPTLVAIDISGWTLDDLDGGGAASFTIPGGTLLVAKGHVTFFITETGIPLNNDGDTVTLRAGSTVVDSFTYASTSKDVSHARQPSGSELWVTSTTPTPFVDEVPQEVGHVVISELLPDPGQDWNEDYEASDASDEFIELYNPAEQDLDISGWTLDDIEDGGSRPYTLPPGTVVAGEGFITFFRGDTGVVLNNGGDEVRLLNAGGTLVDSYAYAECWEEVSFVRQPPGGEVWTTSEVPTPEHSIPDRPPLEDIQGYLLLGRVVPMTREDAVIEDGAVLVRDGRIEAVWSEADGPPAGLDMTNIASIETRGIIFPGLIDAHNHVDYNALEMWPAPRVYTNRYSWQRARAYEDEVKAPFNLLTQGQNFDLLPEVHAYAGVKAIVGGETSFQGLKNRRLVGPVRRVEWNAFNGDHLKTFVFDVAAVKDPQGSYLEPKARGELDGLFIHVAEGTDQGSLDEFAELKDKGLLIEETIIIHGTALTRSNFTEMAAVGAKLVWSPLSNLLLYGDTTDARAAWEEGVVVSLAPDWSPSGSKNALVELKVADQLNQHRMGGFFSDYQLVQMVTVNPAVTCNWSSRLGTIQPGLLADLMVIRDPGGDPYRALINAIDHDVLMVTIEGDPVYGMVPWMEVLKPGEYEVVGFGNVVRGLDTVVDGRNQKTLAQLREELQQALMFDHQHMFDEFDATSNLPDLAAFEQWLEEQDLPELAPINLTPVYTARDVYFFDTLNASTVANLEFNLYDEYYTGPYDSDADGLFDHEEADLGTDPKLRDTDGDTHIDSEDRYPLDGTRWREPGDDDDGIPPVVVYSAVGLTITCVAAGIWYTWRR